MDDGFSANWESALAQLAAEGRGASAKLSVLSLGSVRQRLGEAEWVSHEKRIVTTIETVVGRQLGSQDQVLRVGKDTFVVLVRSVPYEEASRKIQRACDTLARSFFGDNGMPCLSFEAEVTEVVPPGSNQRPRTAVIKGRGEEPAATAAIGVPAATTARETAGAAPGVARRAVPVFKRSDFSFLPTWDVRNEALSVHCVGIWKKDRFSMPLELCSTFGHDDTADRYAAYDAAALQAGVAELARLDAQAKRACAITPLHLKTLESASGRSAYVAVAREIPTDLRKPLVVRLMGVPADKSPTVLEDRLALLQAIFPNIALVVNGWVPEYQSLVATKGIKALTLQLPERAEARKEVLQLMPRIVGLAAGVRRIVSVEGVGTAQEITCAVEAGCRFLTGSAVSPPLREMGPAIVCPRGKLPVRRNATGSSNLPNSAAEAVSG